LQLKPDQDEVRFNFAYTPAAIGRLDEATRHFRAALSLHPDWTATR